MLAVTGCVDIRMKNKDLAVEFVGRVNPDQLSNSRVSKEMSFR